MKRFAAIGLLCALLLPGSAGAAPSPCRDGAGGRPVRDRKDCATQPARKLEPYDPDRLRAGSRPGFIDIGGGTEVRIGGRARLDTTVRP